MKKTILLSTLIAAGLAIAPLAPEGGDYLMRMRILHACSLLANGDLPITEVALQSGFYDHSDFARQFRRQMGLSASTYRATHARRTPS